ncbi:MAG: helix-turn-helix transcriptional regulator [Clostridia bacterium]|nr:helix-turn-helix transcriptional regulator [Clostridia bacterium]
MLTLHTIGMDIRHGAGFEMHRPHGSGDYLLLVFKTDAWLDTEAGRIDAPPGSAVLFAPGQAQHYGERCGGYINHFLHFSGADESSVPGGLRTSTLLTPENLPEMEGLLRMLCLEQASDAPGQAECVSLLLQLVLLKAAQGCAGRVCRSSMAHSAALNLLRTGIYANPGACGPVAEMAAQLGVSVSHLHQLYRAQFGVSCYEDVLAARMNAAMYYLQHTDMTVREIAALCGYENDVVFMRLFKRRTGRTPSQVRGDR